MRGTVRSVSSPFPWPESLAMQTGCTVLPWSGRQALSPVILGSAGHRVGT